MLGDLVEETLEIFEIHGGEDAFINIKYDCLSAMLMLTDDIYQVYGTNLRVSVRIREVDMEYFMTAAMPAAIAGPNITGVQCHVEIVSTMLFVK